MSSVYIHRYVYIYVYTYVYIFMTDIDNINGKRSGKQGPTFRIKYRIGSATHAGFESFAHHQIMCVRVCVGCSIGKGEAVLCLKDLANGSTSSYSCV